MKRVVLHFVAVLLFGSVCAMQGIITPLRGVIMPERQPSPGTSRRLVSEIVLTPGREYSHNMCVVPAPDKPRNILFDNATYDSLQCFIAQDAYEQENMLAPGTIHPAVVSLFSFDVRVERMLASNVRAHMAVQQTLFPALNDDVVDHALTVEHAVSMLLHGTSYLMLPRDQRNGELRLNIVALLSSIVYEIPHGCQPSHRSAWAVLSFVFRNDEWRCIHYCNQRKHPLNTKFMVEPGVFKHPYFLTPLSVVVSIVDGKIVFTYKQEEYDAALHRLGDMQEAEARCDSKQQAGRSNQL